MASKKTTSKKKQEEKGVETLEQVTGNTQTNNDNVVSEEKNMEIIDDSTRQSVFKYKEIQEKLSEIKNDDTIVDNYDKLINIKKMIDEEITNLGKEIIKTKKTPRNKYAVDKSGYWSGGFNTGNKF